MKCKALGRDSQTLHRALNVLLLIIAGAGLASAGEIIDRSTATIHEGSAALWYDLRLLDVEGQGWTETKATYDRLPARAEGIVPAGVWARSHAAAGICARFVTDATMIEARWDLTSSGLAMPHMPATGVSGLDLYVRHDGRWRSLEVGQPKAQTNEAKLVAGMPAGTREFLLYLPLYNGVSSVELGLPKDARLSRADPYAANRHKPIVFYGTSITQGACASRPGMVHSAILQRRLERPMINLGFSANGRMDPEFAPILAELDPAVYVIDCLPNMWAAEVTERVEPFVATLRRARPETPILLVEDRSYTYAFLIAATRNRHTNSRAALKAAYDRMTSAGTPHLYYLTGEDLLGDDGEATVENSHPTDLGFMRQADRFEAALRALLQTN